MIRTRKENIACLPFHFIDRMKNTYRRKEKKSQKHKYQSINQSITRFFTRVDINKNHPGSPREYRRRIPAYRRRPSRRPCRPRRHRADHRR